MRYREKLFVVGLPGSGKSYLGKQLAQQLRLAFIDLDEEIERVAQQPIREIFSERGEAFFRTLERDTLLSIVSRENHFVMATGGGAPCFSDNMARMNLAGITLFVDTPVPIIAKRMRQDGIAVRPLLQELSAERFEEEYRQKFEHRRPYYQLAHLTTTPQESLNSLVSRIKN